MTAGRVRVAMGDGVGIWVMDAPSGFGEPVPHAHHAIQLTLALHGHVRLFDAEAARTGRMQAVAADHPHGFSAEGRIAFVFVEPESEAGRAIAASLFGDALLVDVDLPGIEAMAATLAAGHGDSALLDWAAQLADALTPGALGKPGAGATRACSVSSISSPRISTSRWTCRAPPRACSCRPVACATCSSSRRGWRSKPMSCGAA